MKKIILATVLTVFAGADAYVSAALSMSGNNKINAECRGAIALSAGTDVYENIDVEARAYISPSSGAEYKHYAVLAKLKYDVFYAIGGYGFTNSRGGDFDGVEGGVGVTISSFFADMIYRSGSSNVVGTIGYKYEF